MNIRLAIADDHPMVIQGICNMLSPYKNLEIIARYETGAALLEGLAKEQPDVLLLDIQFPDAIGTDLVRIISEKHPNVRTLAVTSVQNPYTVTDMMSHGCLGYVLKNVSPEVLIQAIETVYIGDEFIEPRLKEQVMKFLIHPAKQTRKAGAPLRLTNREQEILEMICDGLTNYEIGEKLFLSHRTIENQRLALYQKLEVKNTAELVKLSLQMGLLR